MHFEKCPSVLIPEQLEMYRTQGFLAFEEMLSRDEVESALESIRRLNRELIGLSRSSPEKVRTNGGSGNGYTHAGTFLMLAGTEFFIQYQAGEDPLALDPEEAELRIRKLMNFREVDPELGAVAVNPLMLGVVESLLGPGAIVFQDAAFCKPPYVGVEKPWHQDDAYFSYAPVEEVVGVWIALDPATRDNGCMHVIPGGHLRGALKHFHGNDCEIVPDRLDLSRAVPVELEPGGVLFFSGLLPHETPPNRSSLRRRSLQFHFRGASTREVTPGEYDRLFAEADGTPASCASDRRAQVQGSGAKVLD